MTSEKNTDKEEHITPEIDEKLVIIKKNIDFCKTNGIPEALEKGGKYFKNFSALVASTVELEMTQLSISLKNMLPFSRNVKEGKKLVQIIENILEESKDHFSKMTSTGDEEGIKNEIEKCRKSYADKYVEYQLSRLCL